MKKVIKEGELIPAWYGVTWVDWASRRVVCYPMPLNRVLAFLNDIRLWLKYANKAVSSNCRLAYSDGFRDGEHATREQLAKADHP